MDKIVLIVISLAAFAVGVGLSYWLLSRVFARWKTAFLHNAQQQTERLEQQKRQEATEQFNQLRNEFRNSCQQREEALVRQESDLRRREGQVRDQQNELQRTRREVEGLRKSLDGDRMRLDNEAQRVEASKAEYQNKLSELDTKTKEADRLLESVAGLTVDQARQQLMQRVEEDAHREAVSLSSEIIDEARLTADKEAKKIVIQSLQRLATETAVENSVSTFHIDSDDVKGKIIGREGRNIRTLEALTGVEVIVDDTPDTVVLSAFDPVRRELARLALHQLVQDGRIHPARIEEVVNRVRKQLEEEIMETGKRTVIDLGVHPMHAELVRMVGRMKYRSSYGQNLLQHSREVANLCAIMASELGLNVKLAKRAGLLHDIGKVAEDTPDKPHAIVGMEMAQKYKEKPEVCNAIGAHHDEVEMSSLISPIVQVCDSISGARPGARREVVESYIKRLQDMESLAKSYPGVEKSYAIQAGRELRVIVGSDKVTDNDASSLAAEIAKRIQDEMTYPGQVKVTVIRETRAVMIAK